MISHHLNLWLSDCASKLDAKKGPTITPTIELAIEDHADSSDTPLADLSVEQALSELAMILAREDLGLPKQDGAARFCQFWHLRRAGAIITRIVEERGMTVDEATAKLQSLMTTYSAALYPSVLPDSTPPPEPGIFARAYNYIKSFFV